MSLKITKDRSNIDNLDLQESAEEFVDNIAVYAAHAEGRNSIASGNCSHAEGINTVSIRVNSAKSLKDTLYEWDSSYKKFYQHMNDSFKTKEYNSWYE